MKKKDVNRIKLILKDWRENHQAEYADFQRTVDAAMNDGDTTLFLRNIFVLKNAKPKGIFGKLDGLIDKIVFTGDDRKKMDSAQVDADTPSGSISPIDVAYTGVYALKNKEQIAQQIANDKPIQVWCMYYWLFWEDGASKMETIIANSKYSEKHAWWIRPLTKMAIRTMVKISVNTLMSSKSSWNKTVKAQPDEEMKDEINSVLAVTKGTSQGREEKNDDLKNLLMGNKKELLKRIEFFVSTRKYDSHLAYILIALEDAGKIVKGCEFMTFYRAIVAKYPNAGIGDYDRAQRIYGTYKNRPTTMKERQKRELRDEVKKMFLSFKETDLIG